MRKYLLFYSGIICLYFNTTTAEQMPPESIELPPEIELLKRKHEEQALDQVLNVENEPCPCLKVPTEDFIDCMAYANKQEVRETFAKMNLYARLHYLYRMDLFQYHHFLQAFEIEEQWQETLNTLEPEEQQKLPQTLLEQLIMIRDVWLECSDKTLGNYAKGSKDPEANDIAAWRYKALNGPEKDGVGFHFYYLEWLRERFMEKKVSNFL